MIRDLLTNLQGIIVLGIVRHTHRAEPQVLE